MTKLAIIGGGIAGRSLLYALAKSKKNFSEITLFDSDSFAHTCSMRSTAIVAARGVTAGHSDLGNLLIEGFKTFSHHVRSDSPMGVFPITQYSGALTKLDQFKKRYPLGSFQKEFPPFSLSEETYMATEVAFLVETAAYLEWLGLQANKLPLIIKREFVTGLNRNEIGIELKTQTGKCFSFDKVVFAGGIYNRYWDQKIAGKAVQGSYFQFTGTDLGKECFSLTLEGDNLVYHAHTKTLLIGSSTANASHELPPAQELASLYKRLSDRLSIDLPAIETAKIITGIREKAAKRTPYVIVEGNTAWIGGLYKNGFGLGLHLSMQLADSL